MVAAGLSPHLIGRRKSGGAYSSLPIGSSGVSQRAARASR